MRRPSTTRALMCALAVVWLLASCASPGVDAPSDTTSDRDATVEVEVAEDTDAPAPDVVWLAAPPPSGVAWSPLGELAVDASGVSPRLTVALPEGQRYIALRARPLDGASTGVCLRFEPIESDSGEVLVEEPALQSPGAVCDRCTQPVSSGHGDGLAVLSSGPDPLSTPQNLTFGIAARDCAWGVLASQARFPERPTRVAIEVATEAAPDEVAKARLGVRIAYAPDTVFGEGSLVDNPDFEALWEAARVRFEAIGVELVLEAVAALPPRDDMVYGPEDMSRVDALSADVLGLLSRGADDTRFVPVALVTCLRASHPLPERSGEPLGESTRIPGMVEASTSLVMLAAGGCTPTPTAPWSFEHGGVILAHELGHHLGLYHSDTAAGRMQVEGSEHALMVSGVANLTKLEAAFFSPLQARVLWRHPAVVWE